MPVFGQCHCGALRYTLQWPDMPATLPARACDCSFCQRHGAAWTSHPQGQLHIGVAHPDALTRYRFATATADFLLCRHCGVVVACTSLIDDRLYAVVNVRALVGRAPDSLAVSALSLGEESPGERLQRRRKRWIGQVQIEPLHDDQAAHVDAPPYG